MPVQTAANEVNGFIKGLITEASPLTFPDNASIDEVNMIPNRDGSRNRRLGMNFEEGAVRIDSGVTYNEGAAISSYTWKNPGGYADKEFSVLQIGGDVIIFDTSVFPISSGIQARFHLSDDPSIRFSMTSVDGILIIATGSPIITSIDYNGTFVRNTGRLRIRDLFGVEDIYNGQDLREGQGLATRPTTLTNQHLYNLRNQTWAIPRYINNDETLADVVKGYFNYNGNYQSNSDSLNPYYYAFPNDADDRETQRFNARDLDRNPLGTNLAPIGYFIIDALARGTSRLEEVAKLMANYPRNELGVSSLPQDTTPGGATVVGAYAGRVWYAGFSSQLIDGDSNSPRMTSYILFSRLVDKFADIYKCYQDGDPTSTVTPDLVDTDGGFIRIDGAYNIQSLINVGDAMLVIAENGVWRISGGSGYGFKATDYLTSKITEHGTISPGSVTVVDNTVMYWSDDGIYHASPNQYGDWTATNLSTETIKSFFDDIPYSQKVSCRALYDSYERRVRWLYNNIPGVVGETKELILDVNIGAYYPSTIRMTNSSNQYPRLLTPIKAPPFRTGIVTQSVLTNIGDFVYTVGGDPVVTTETSQIDALSETVYITLTGVVNGNFQLTISSYRDLSFTDWMSYDGTGVDANAFILTGWTGFGDFQRQKQVPYLTVYSIKTETGFESDFSLVNSSSILIQSQWAWTNSAEAGKWGSEFQAYRHKRLWIPQDSSSGFDDGEHVVVTKNKLRGRGRVVSLLFKTEPKKDFKLLGWSFLINVNGTV